MARAVSVALITFLALPVQAAPPEGVLRFGLTDTPAGAGPEVFADVDWTLRFGAGGIALGSYGVWTEDSHPHETYATLFVDLGPGRLSAGVPRPAYDQFAVATVDHTLPSLGIAFLPSTRSHATAIAADGAGVPLGALYRTGAGATGVAVSAHRIARTDTQLLSFGGGVEQGDWQLSFGAEWVDRPGTQDLNAKLQAGLDLQGTRLSASYFTANGQDAPDLAELAATMPLGTRVEATVFAALPTADPEDGVLGAAARLELGDHIVLDAAAAHGDGDSWLGASIGWQF